MEMVLGQQNDQIRIISSILKKYPHESNDLSISPLRDSSRGKVDDEDVLISYRQERRDYRHTGTLYDCIVWHKDSSDHGTCAVEVIALKYVVGIHPLGGRHSSKHSLLFVHPSDNSDSSHDMNLTLRSIKVDNPPEDLLSDFLCSEEPGHFFVPHINSSPNLHVLLSNTVNMDVTMSTWQNLVHPLLEHFALAQHADYAVYSISSEDEVIDFVSCLLLPRATQGIQQTVVLLGGDDAVTLILNTMLSSGSFKHWGRRQSTTETDPFNIPGFVKPKLGLIPCGTSNVLAHNNYITGNRITKHSTRGLRTLLLGEIDPLPYFRATFSPGAQLIAESTQGKKRSSFGKTQGLQTKHRPAGDEEVSTLYGAIAASWALHPHEMSQHHKISRSSIGTTVQDHSQPATFPACKGKVTLYEAARLLPDGLGLFTGLGTERRELVRREHTCVLATCCAFLDEELEISPENQYGQGFRVIEFGPSLPQTQRNSDALKERTKAEDDSAISGVDDRTRKAIEAAHSQGAHVRDSWVGYHEVQSIRIETCSTENERERLFCVDGKLIALEEAGWVEVTTMDCYKEGVLDLIYMGWEGSELSIGEEQKLIHTGDLSYPVEFAPDDDPEGWQTPVDEVR
ncbi:hypothetical protein KC330_g6167 [Hortaea werneckii]|nr:hypothetical protein KC330_g6167 [Hortaea werneckii]